MRVAKSPASHVKKKVQLAAMSVYLKSEAQTRGKLMPSQPRSNFVNGDKLHPRTQGRP